MPMSEGVTEVADLITQAELHEPIASETSIPRLHVDQANPHLTVREVQKILSKSGLLYDRGTPVRIVRDATTNGWVAQVITAPNLCRLVHSVCRPFRIDRNGRAVDCAFPPLMAVMYLDARGEWDLPVLNGIVSSPLLRADGSIGVTSGYDRDTGLWGADVPDLADLIPARPSRDEANAALLRVRSRFRTFPFADATTVVPDDPYDPYASPTVDISAPPGKDEAAFLTALLTAVARASLRLSPGILIRAPAMSGAGSGKGLLARCLSIIAFGREPHAVNAGPNNEETEKRIAAELMEGHPVLFLDNLNNTSFKSDLLASVLTERPARVRILGKSQMVPLNSTALVIMTGNALTISEDLARRFLIVELDARMEDPEVRRFANDIKEDVRAHRQELLLDLLTIWRWGVQSSEIKTGKPLGSFEQWGKMVRDALVTLGCVDPVDRIGEVKERDGRRQEILECFALWTKHHGERPVRVQDLHDDIRGLLDPQGRGRQFLQRRVQQLDGTRLNGRAMTRQAATGPWGVATYALKATGEAEGHRGHRGLRNEGAQEAVQSAPQSLAPVPETPMPPMPQHPANENECEPQEEAAWKTAIGPR